MLRTPMFLGFSMVPRKNRRALVVCTYAILIVVTVIGILLTRPEGIRFSIVWAWFTLVYNVVSGDVFGRLIRYTVYPERPWHTQSHYLTLGIGWHWGEGRPDEREVGIRNAAYFGAYRALATYAVILWLSVPFVVVMSTRAGVLVLELLIMPLVTMAVTLPQAVVLWTEPDVPEEARV